MKRKCTKEEKYVNSCTARDTVVRYCPSSCRRLRDKFKTVARLLEAEEYEQLLASLKSE